MVNISDMELEIEDRRPKIILEECKIKEGANDYGFSDEPFNRENFIENLKIVPVKKEENELEFDIIGITPAIANAFRRIMLSEVPTMAIEKVYIYNNTSLLQDEVLAHRLGLIPLKADPRHFEQKLDEKDDEGNELDTLEFRLDIKCTWKNKDMKDPRNFDAMYKNHNIYTEHIKWVPRGKQGSLFNESQIGPCDDKILISKMRPGHELNLKLLAVKGIGKDHAKFSPVSVASYKLLPEIKLLKKIKGSDAHLLQTCFSPGVIEIDKSGCAYVKNARNDNCSRNVYRYPDIAKNVVLTRIRNHFIFNIESLGAYKPEDIFIEAVKTLKKKCSVLLKELDFDEK